jgi:hypothetical protein
MGCINQRVDALAGKVLRKALRTAETANPSRDRLWRGRCGAAREGDDHVEIRASGKLDCEAARFGSATEYQDAPYGQR